MSGNNETGSEEMQKEIEKKLKPSPVTTLAVELPPEPRATAQPKRELDEEGRASPSLDAPNAKDQQSTEAQAHELEEEASENQTFSSCEDIAPLPAIESTNRTPAHSVVGAHAVAGPARFSNPRNRGLSNLRSPSGNDLEQQGTSTLLAAYLHESDSSNHSQGDNSSSHMAGASEMEEVAVLELDAVQPMVLPDKNDSSDTVHNTARLQNKHFLLLLVACVLAMALVLLAIFLVQASKNDSGSASGNASGSASGGDLFDTGPAPPNTTQEAETYPPFQEDLAAATMKALQEGPTTAESKANVWMWNDPYLNIYSKERQRQRFALAATYFATQGDHWLNNDFWLDYEVSECLWFSKATEGPVCQNHDATQLPLVTLDLHANNLTGTLPPSFWFSQPNYLDLGYNNLQGTVPAFPSNSEFLEVLVISSNYFTGRLQGGAGLSAGNIRIARLDNNQIQGNNAAIYQLTPKMEILNYSSTLISGAIATQLQYLTNLRYLGAAYTLLEGTMPSELALMTSLQFMDYSGNMGLTGTIPSELSLLTNLLELDIADTGFTGVLPEAFCGQKEQGLLSVAANCSSIVCCSR